MTKLEFLETWFRRVWIEEDMSAIPEMLQPAAHVEGLREIPQVGPEEFAPFVSALLTLVKVRSVEVKRSLEVDDWLSALLALKLECRKTGKEIFHTGQVMVRIEGDAIVEGYNHFDFFTLFEGVGLLPETTLSQCVQGTRLSAA